jgi:hypothetical protein
MLKNIEHTVANMEAIGLHEMDSVSLMKRTDTKFLLKISDLNLVLKNIYKDYQILEIGENRVMSYASMYYDTSEKGLYHDHHNGRVNRVKVRIRKYIESDICFLEVKQKNGKGTTDKSRIPIDNFEKILSDSSNAFIEKTTSKSMDLLPTLQNNFNRITLVSVLNKERVTIDFNLGFTSKDNEFSYDDVAIIELKQEGYNRNSSIVKELRKLQIYSNRFSKYCMGIIGLYEGVKYNKFKEKVLLINKLTA